MVSDLVLQTKLHPPTLAATTVVRPRLLRRLQQGTKTRLTLIAAPAGFGKTTLVATYLAQLGTASSKPGGQEAQPRLGWIALDRSDNDFAR
ncbi:MAG: hypothetical protein KDE58_15495, partial [Caldilineaceae bacterium]|nr:hypothetical protein [Caldilineaceae bacterium]